MNEEIQKLKEIVERLEKVRVELKRIGHESLPMINSSKRQTMNPNNIYNGSVEINKIAKTEYDNIKEIENDLLMYAMLYVKRQD